MDDSQKILISNFCTKNHIIDLVDLFVATHKLIPKKENRTVVLACSGGPDSVFLAEYLGHQINKKKYDVILVYIDHEWRPESKQEVDFCHSLAEKKQFLFETTTLDQIKNSHQSIKMNGSKEAYARALRSIFLQETAQKYNAHTIFLGHHQDDQIETFFIRLIRGTSLTGLCAMQPRSGLFVRPLLCLKKTQILTFLNQNEISYLIDASNEDPRYLRNRIRNRLLPTLEIIDHRSKNNIAALIERLQNAEHCLEMVTKDIFDNIVIKKDNILYLSIPELMALPQELQYRVLLQFFIQHSIRITFSESLFHEVLRFLVNKKSNTHKISIDFVLKKESNYVHIFE